MNRIVKCIFWGLILIVVLGTILTLKPLYGATTGKITGRVTNAETGAGLAGINVIIDDTYLGTATDEKGYYTILNVSPGTYVLRFEGIGYTNAKVRNVKVAIDLTTTINAQMSAEVLGMQEVIATAQRPVVIEDISNSRLDISSDQIENIPVENISEIIGLQAGIEGLYIRGSDPAQATFLLDGLSLNDERENIPYTTISLSAVKEVQVQTGGFNAEYGDVRSGVINVVTREGGLHSYSGRITLRYSPAAPKHFGPSVYSHNTYYTRPFTDPEVCWTGTHNGAWDRYTQQQYTEFEGYYSLSKKWNSDTDPSNDLTPAAIKRLWEWHHRRQGDIKKPDYHVDGGFGGPVPFISDKLGDLRFFTSYYQVHEMFVVPLYRDSYDESNFQLKLTSNITNHIKLSLEGLYGTVASVCPDQWQIPPSGSVVRSPESITARVNSTTGDEIFYMPDYFTPSDIFRTQIGLKLTHQLNERTFYELKLSSMSNIYDAYGTAYRDTAAKYEIIKGLYMDEAPYGYYPPLNLPPSPGGYLALGGWMGFGRDDSKVITSRFEFDCTSQINRFNQVKGGLDVIFTDYDVHSRLYHPHSIQWSHHYKRVAQPYRLGTFIQNKLEFEGLILNAGLRLDYSNPNTKWYDLAVYDTLLTSQYGEQIEQKAPQEPVDPQWVLSPRLGVSHPITEDSKLYFNYGHFNALPSSEYRFHLDWAGTGQVKYLGNPGIDYARTVAYELGYEQNIFGQYLLKLAGYYKDITDQPSWITYLNSEQSIGVSRAGTDSYEDIRGFEITFRKNAGRWFYGFINYTYMVHTRGYFGVRYQYEDIIEQKVYEKNNPYIERPVPRPYFRANLNFHIPRDFGILGGWNLNLLTHWKAGETITYNPSNLPGVQDNVQWKDYHNIDMRFSKIFKIKNISLECFIDASNVLNNKHFSTAGFSDFNDRIAYMESLHFDWEEGLEHGDDRMGEYRSRDVDYIPMVSTENVYDINEPVNRVLYYDQTTERYMQYRNDTWITRSEEWTQKNVLDKKAYIDMPNLTYFTFLNPRNITLGIKINF